MRLEGCVYIYAYDYCLYILYIYIYIYIKYIILYYIRYILRVGVVVVFIQILDVSFLSSAVVYSMKNTGYECGSFHSYEGSGIYSKHSHSTTLGTHTHCKLTAPSCSVLTQSYVVGGGEYRLIRFESVDTYQVDSFFLFGKPRVDT